MPGYSPSALGAATKVRIGEPARGMSVYAVLTIMLVSVAFWPTATSPSTLQHRDNPHLAVSFFFGQKITSVRLIACANRLYSAACSGARVHVLRLIYGPFPMCVMFCSALALIPLRRSSGSVVSEGKSSKAFLAFWRAKSLCPSVKYASERLSYTFGELG